MIAVFDGKSVNANFPYDNKDALDPGLILRSLEKDAAHPTSVEPVERNGRKLTAFYCRDGASETTLYVDPVTRIPVQFVGRVKSGQAINLEFKFIEFDVKAHEAELFDTTKLKSFFSEYLPPRKPSAPRLPGSAH